MLPPADILLVINLALDAPHSLVWSHADTLLHTLEEIRHRHPLRTVRIVWLESIFLRHVPRLSQMFSGNAHVETVYRPFFGLDPRDVHLWSGTPTIISLMCQSHRLCWWMDLLDPPQQGAPPEAPESSLLPGATPRPTEHGCWYMLPTGCPSGAGDGGVASGWLRDAWGELGYHAKDDAVACLEVRRQLLNSWCGVSDVVMHFVGPPERSIEISHAPLRTVIEAAAFGHEASAPHGVLNFIGCGRCRPFPSYHAMGAVSEALREWPAWGKYIQSHAEAVADARSSGLDLGLVSSGRSRKVLVWACQPATPCGGHGDRLKGIVATFVLALLTDRLFFIDSPDPWDLRLFMEPAFVDWRVSGLIGIAAGRHVLWDHEMFQASYLDSLLDADEPLWVIYTNKKSLLGPMLKHTRLQDRAADFGLFTLPHLTYHIWNVLFRPTASLEKHWRRLNLALGGESAAYVALHHRAGDLTSGFGVVNGEVDRRNGPEEVVVLLGCAHSLEHRLGLPNTTKWYLASDNIAVLDIPQVAVWFDMGKLIVQQPSEQRTHLANAGVVPPSGSKPLTREPASATGGDKQSPKMHQSPVLGGVMESAAALVGVADAWVDFLAILRASAVVVSSSAFGVMAAQAGGVEHTFTTQGCARVDLLV